VRFLSELRAGKVFTGYYTGIREKAELLRTFREGFKKCIHVLKW